MPHFLKGAAPEFLEPLAIRECSQGVYFQGWVHWADLHCSGLRLQSREENGVGRGHEGRRFPLSCEARASGLGSGPTSSLTASWHSRTSSCAERVGGGHHAARAHPGKCCTTPEGGTPGPSKRVPGPGPLPTALRVIRAAFSLPELHLLTG